MDFVNLYRYKYIVEWPYIFLFYKTHLPSPLSPPPPLKMEHQFASWTTLTTSLQLHGASQLLKKKKPLQLPCHYM